MSLISSLFDTIRGFFEPQSLETYYYYAEYGECYMMEFTKPLPRVTLMTDKLLRQWNPEVPSMEELGYTAYEKNISMRTTYYARRPWVWLLKARILAVRKLWSVLSRMYGKVWYFKRTAFSQPHRWRDVRLGSGVLPEERLASASLIERARTLQAEIDTQHKEIEYLKLERDASYSAGMDSGWRQHAQVVERYIDDMQKAKD